jgi:hypothetical protein
MIITTHAPSFFVPFIPRMVTVGIKSKSHCRDLGIWRCDGFFAASSETVDDPLEIGLGQIYLPHEGPEEYEKLCKPSALADAMFECASNFRWSAKINYNV